MISTSHNLNDDWGWFVDIENNKYTHYIQLEHCRTKIYENVVPEDVEDEYDYFKKKFYDNALDELIDEYCNMETGKKNNNISTSILIKLTTTTLCTGLITYVLLCVL